MLELNENLLSSDEKREINTLLTEFHKRGKAFSDMINLMEELELTNGPGPKIRENVAKADALRDELAETAAKIEEWYEPEERRKLTIVHNGKGHVVTRGLFLCFQTESIVDVTGCGDR